LHRVSASLEKNDGLFISEGGCEHGNSSFKHIL
jgi:hypothetical protein